MPENVYSHLHGRATEPTRELPNVPVTNKKKRVLYLWRRYHQDVNKTQGFRILYVAEYFCEMPVYKE